MEPGIWTHEQEVYLAGLTEGLKSRIEALEITVAKQQKELQQHKAVGSYCPHTSI